MVTARRFTDASSTKQHTTSPAFGMGTMSTFAGSPLICMSEKDTREENRVTTAETCSR
jgi:hypothetical protein